MSEVDNSPVLPTSAAPALRLLGILTRFQVGIDIESRVIEAVLDNPPLGLLATFQMVESSEIGLFHLTDAGATTARRLVQSWDVQVELPDDIRMFSLQAAGMDCFGLSYTTESEHCQGCRLAFACREMLPTWASHLATQLTAADRAEDRKQAAVAKAASEKATQEAQERFKEEQREKADINDIMSRLKATAPK